MLDRRFHQEVGFADSEVLWQRVLLLGLDCPLLWDEHTPAELERLRVHPALVVGEHDGVVALILDLVGDLHRLVFGGGVGVGLGLLGLLLLDQFRLDDGLHCSIGSWLGHRDCGAGGRVGVAS